MAKGNTIHCGLGPPTSLNNLENVAQTWPQVNQREEIPQFRFLLPRLTTDPIQHMGGGRWRSRRKRRGGKGRGGRGEEEEEEEEETWRRRKGRSKKVLRHEFDCYILKHVDFIVSLFK